MHSCVPTQYHWAPLPKAGGGSGAHTSPGWGCLRPGGHVGRLAAPPAWEITPGGDVEDHGWIVRSSPPVPSGGTSAREGAVPPMIRPGTAAAQPYLTT